LQEVVADIGGKPGVSLKIPWCILLKYLCVAITTHGAASFDVADIIDASELDDVAGQVKEYLMSNHPGFESDFIVETHIIGKGCGQSSVGELLGVVPEMVVGGIQRVVFAADFRTDEGYHRLDVRP
jgi:hypothetical protein